MNKFFSPAHLFVANVVGSGWLTILAFAILARIAAWVKFANERAENAAATPCWDDSWCLLALLRARSLMKAAVSPLHRPENSLRKI